MGGTDIAIFYKNTNMKNLKNISCTKVKALLLNRAELTIIGGNIGILNTPCRGHLQTSHLALTGTRSYSTAKPGDNPSVVKYDNADMDKLRILSENKGKGGVYMWTHKATGKRYIGSSLDLRRRFSEYFNVNRLLRASSMRINLAILKYGYSAFSLEILVYCDTSELMREEKHWIDHLNPEYNILKEPGSPNRGNGWKHSEDAIRNMKEAQQNRSPVVRTNMSKAQFYCQEVIVTDLVTGTKTTYHAIRAAAKGLNIDYRYIYHFLNLKQTRPVLDRYTFELVGDQAERSRVQPTSIQVEVIDLETDQKNVYPTIGLAAKSLGSRQSSVSTYLCGKKLSPFKGRYIITKCGSPEEPVLVPVIEVTDLMDGGNKTTHPSITAAGKAVNASRASVSKYLGTNKPYRARYLFNMIEVAK
jgi:group I intron endonuclease